MTIAVCYNPKQYDFNSLGNDLMFNNGTAPGIGIFSFSFSFMNDDKMKRRRANFYETFSDNN